jgi:hypothetical protein
MIPKDDQWHILANFLTSGNGLEVSAIATVDALNEAGFCISRVPTLPDPLLEAAKEAREYLGGIDSEAGTIDRICRDLDAAIKERDEA